MTEMAVQQLLLEAGADDLDQELVVVEPRGLEVAADWRTLRSPETYLGYAQGSGFASATRARFDAAHRYAAAPHLPLNHWDLSGTWTVTQEAAVLQESVGRVAFQFEARDVNLVMGPAAGSGPIPFRVFLDGEAGDGAAGTDVAADGRGTLDEQRTYQLVRQPGPIMERRFEIEFAAAGAEAYCFTFG
jgi:hypothetical protein